MHLDMVKLNAIMPIVIAVGIITILLCEYLVYLIYCYEDKKLRKITILMFIFSLIPIFNLPLNFILCMVKILIGFKQFCEDKMNEEMGEINGKNNSQT